MKNPPRTTKIRGQKHLLAYITPDEAKLLKAMGGSGEKVHGIPSYPGGYGGEGMGGFGGMTDGGMSDNSGGRLEDADVDTMTPGESMAQYGTPAFAGSTPATAPSQSEVDAAKADYQSSDKGFDVNLAKAMTDITMAPPDQRLNFVDRAIMKAYQTGKQPGLFGLLGFDLGRTQNYQTVLDRNLGSIYGSPKGIFGSFENQAPSFGMPGFISEIFDIDPYVTTSLDYMNGDPDAGGRDDVVPTQTNPVTGQEECPDGYMFDEDLQACRLSADLPFGTPVTTPGPYDAGDYARMGLLDIAPMGMSLFADRYGIPQMDFDTANLAFRRAGATRPQYFRQAPDLTGYTLLA